VKPLRVAVAGVGHYHAAFTPVYLDLIKQHGGELVAVADSDLALAEDRARRFGGRAYGDVRRMLEIEGPDFVIGLGRHYEMPEIFRGLVEAGVPFLMEKPWGTDAATVRELARLAEQRNAWVATPFSFRYTRWAETARELMQRGELGRISHVRFRMVRPGVQRYRDQDSAWMLNRREAGGGVLLNLGVHGFDLARYLTGEEPEVVGAVTSNAVFGLDVEDYAAVTLRTSSGAVCHVEVGYTFPTATGRDDERVIATDRLLLRDGDGPSTGSGQAPSTGSGRGGCTIVRASGEEVVPEPAGYASMWSGVIADCLARVARGEPPPTTPEDAAKAVGLVFEAYERAARR
jgi:predicted dehydrogenase